MHRRRLLAASLAASLFSAGSPAAGAERRRIRVLTLGNDYQHAGVLPRLDRALEECSQFARAAGRLPHAHATDVPRFGVADLRDKLRAFLGDLETDDIVVLHYAGHGVQIGDQNYAVTDDGASLISLQDIMYRMRGQQSTRTLVAFIDACRDNPFSDAGADLNLLRYGDLLDESDPERLTPESLKQVGLGNFQAVDQIRMFVLFASAPGATAPDSVRDDDPLSPFGAALVRHIGDRVNVQTLFTRISADVDRATAELPGGVRQSPHWQVANTHDLWLAGQPRMRPLPL